MGTVSRVINNSPFVSEKTRERVLKVIEELNYVPSPTAQRLSLGKTLTLAVIVPFFTRPAFVERLRGIELTLADSDYDLILYNVETVKRRDECLRQIPRSERADGVIVLSLSPRDEDIPFLQNATVPVVLVDANHPSLVSFNRVTVDDVYGGYCATRHLIELNHRRIGYVSDFLDNPFNFTSSRDRYQGYCKALQEASIPLLGEYHGQGEHNRHEARRLAIKMLRLDERPTAIFAASDTQAMGVIEAARDLGLRIPQELSVIGYDDIEISEHIGLTTIRQLLFESGQRGVEILLEVLEKPAIEPIKESLPTELIYRNTTSQAPQ